MRQLCAARIHAFLTSSSCTSSSMKTGRAGSLGVANGHWWYELSCRFWRAKVTQSFNMCKCFVFFLRAQMLTTTYKSLKNLSKYGCYYKL